MVFQTNEINENKKKIENEQIYQRKTKQKLNKWKADTIAGHRLLMKLAKVNNLIVRIE